MKKSSKQNSIEIVGSADLGMSIKLILKLLSLWFICLLVFIASLFFATNQFATTIDNTDFGKSSFFGFILLAAFLLGVAAFLSAIHKLNKQLIRLLDKASRGIWFIRKFPFLIKYLISISILPVPLFFYMISRLKRLFSLKIKNRAYILRIFGLGLILLIILPVWFGGYFIAGVLGASQLGYLDEPISIGGTGSMYPTFPKGQTKTLQEQGDEVVATQGMFPYPNGLVLFGKRLFGHEIGRGDIVVIENSTINEYNKKLLGESSGWVKRVIGISGDTVELKDGIVYLNNERIKEQYIAKPRSTFGQMFLKDCTKVVVPQDSVFIMGDNRKGSGDSREIGFISLNDIRYVLPINTQKGVLDKNWRDTSGDFDESSKTRLEKTKYLELLNSAREKTGAKPLKYQTKLERSALNRGEVILKFDDLSYEASRSGYTQLRAFNDVGYYNITYGEIPTLGYYEADEITEYQFEFPETKEFLLNKDFQEIGIAEVEGTINGCPAQVIIQHFAGYVPPNYSKQDIESWRQAISNLNDVIPSWYRVKGQSWINQDDLKRLLDLLNRERAIASNVLSRMEGNQWLTRDEESSIKEYDRLSKESIELAKKLNSQ